mmetsp:Transcript_43261/g.122541  ORF Transcript_43261/g.122541 Transcript_43261/m.122541 type:complete len:241 (-) Transcript_43261:2247-2969(-)
MSSGFLFRLSLRLGHYLTDPGLSLLWLLLAAVGLDLCNGAPGTLMTIKDTAVWLMKLEIHIGDVTIDWPNALALAVTYVTVWVLASEQRTWRFLKWLNKVARGCYVTWCFAMLPVLTSCVVVLIVYYVVHLLVVYVVVYVGYLLTALTTMVTQMTAMTTAFVSYVASYLGCAAAFVVNLTMTDIVYPSIATLAVWYLNQRATGLGYTRLLLLIVCVMLPRVHALPISPANLAGWSLGVWQ